MEPTRHRRSERYQAEEPQPYARPPKPERRITAAPPQQEEARPERRRRAERSAELPPSDERISRKRQITAAPERKEAPRRRMPRLIFALMTLLFFTALTLLAGTWWMRAYITQKNNEAQQAHEALVEAHPLLYREWIEQYARQYNLQPALVAAIIRNESSFDPKAESGIGARGLMQLMEKTADWINSQYLHESGYTFARMWDPECNIRFGCWYLGYLSRLFQGDPVSVIAAYHAGQGTVRDNWLTNKDISPDGRTLTADALPEGQTKTYVRRVTRDYGIYDALVYHAFNSPDPADGAADGAR